MPDPWSYLCFLLAGMTAAWYHAHLFDWLTWDLLNSTLPGQPQTVILPSSTSWVARIIDTWLTNTIYQITLELLLHSTSLIPKTNSYLLMNYLFYEVFK
jgi:hypothetical protein